MHAIKLTDDSRLIRMALNEAYHIAAGSPDPSNQNGATIIQPLRDTAGYVTGFRTEAKACNGFHPAIMHTPQHLADRNWKLAHIEHAERAAIYQHGRFRADHILICPWFACIECARAIALSGCKLVIGHHERMELTPDRWRQSVDAGMRYLETCGVETYFHHGPVNSPIVIVNGEPKML